IMNLSGKKVDAAAKPIIARLGSFLGEMKKFVNNQENLELNSERGKDSRMRVIICLLAGLVLNTILAVYLASGFNKDALRRLNSLLQNTQLFKENKKLNPVIAGSDEIALLDGAFHSMAEELQEISARKRELQAMVTHDLRTPLTNIRLSLASLLDGIAGELPSRAQKIAEKAERNCSRLIRLINDLLDIEKLEGGQFTLNKSELHLALLFESVEDTTAEFAAEKSITIEVSEPSAIVNADGDRLVQVLVNLVSNAIKFSEKGKRVWLDAKEKDKTVEISVRDEGRGIPAEALPKIFDRFHQVTAADGARGKGTGLGLSISKALVEAHGGTIRLESELGKGTTFFIELPRLTV
ncbi:MAG: HAMP domain-containing histidine kinase, partial [Candidatus Obscuribacterales bacterium]|nr:HAMP domain-containing histidine kinase [Candidatus Obscuribacterales bacterium]